MLIYDRLRVKHLKIIYLIIMDDYFVGIVKEVFFSSSIFLVIEVDIAEIGRHVVRSLSSSSIFSEQTSLHFLFNLKLRNFLSLIPCFPFLDWEILNGRLSECGLTTEISSLAICLRTLYMENFALFSYTAVHQ